MDELEYFSKEDKIEYGILVFTIHNITQDALLWNELHNNMICEFDGIKFTKEPPKELGELYLTQDNMIYIEYNAKYTSKSLFGFYILQRIPMFVLQDLNLINNKYIYVAIVFLLLFPVNYIFNKIIKAIDLKIF